MRLRRPTELYRFTVSTTGAVALDGTDGSEGPIVGKSPDGGLRRVTVIPPDSPTVLVALDEPPQDAGPGRTGYKWAPLPPSIPVKIWLLPEQQLFATAAPSGPPATGSVLIEYPLEEG